MRTRDDMPQTLGGAVATAARRWPDRHVLRFVDGVDITFAELDRHTNRAAHGLHQLGVRQGDSVAVMMGNRPEFPVLWLGLAKLGAVIVPTNPAYGTDDLAHVLAVTHPKLILTDDASLDIARNASVDLDAPPGIMSVESPAEQLGSWAATLGDATDEMPSVSVVADQLVNLQFTSGSTGTPKACMLTHRYWLEIARAAGEEMPKLTADDIVLACTPFHYMDPQWELASCLTTGATLVVMRRFEADHWLNVVREYEPTFCYLLGVMPTLLWKTESRPDDADNTLRAITCSAIPHGMHDQLEARFGTPWFESYGSTECGSVVRVHMEDHDEAVRLGYIGTPLSHREVRIIDDEGNPVDRLEVGELVVRGTGLMDGYYRDPEATAQVFRGGWFRTGDIAWLDADGHVFLKGRIKETIRRGGQNVAPAEVTATIAAHPNVRHAAVIGVPDLFMGEEVEAHVVLIDDSAPSDQVGRELREFCRSRLARYKVPRYWVFVPVLPLTASGKVATANLLQHRSKQGKRWDARSDRESTQLPAQHAGTAPPRGT